MYLLVLEDGSLQQTEKITDDLRRMVADGTLTVVQEDAGRFTSLITELDPGVEPERDADGEPEDEEDEPEATWVDDWERVPKVDY